MGNAAKYFASGLLGAIGQAGEKVQARRYEQEEKSAELLKQMSLYELKSSIDQRDKIADETRAADAARGDIKSWGSAIPDPDNEGSFIQIGTDIKGVEVARRAAPNPNEMTPYQQATIDLKKEENLLTSALKKAKNAEEKGEVERKLYETYTKQIETNRSELRKYFDGDENEMAQFLTAMNSGTDEDIQMQVEQKFAPEKQQLIKDMISEINILESARAENPYSPEFKVASVNAEKRNTIIKESGVPKKNADQILNMPDDAFNSAVAVIASGVKGKDKDALKTYDLLIKLSPERAAKVEEEVMNQKGEAKNLSQAANISQRQNQPQASSKANVNPLADVDKGLLVDDAATQKADQIADEFYGLSERQFDKKLSEYARMAKTNPAFAPIYKALQEKLMGQGLL